MNVRLIEERKGVIGCRTPESVDILQTTLKNTQMQTNKQKTKRMKHLINKTKQNKHTHTRKSLVGMRALDRTCVHYCVFALPKQKRKKRSSFVVG